jgi:DnaJ-class molecular chaperone
MMDADFELLGVARGASAAATRAAYRRLALLYHPDKPGGSQERFAQLHAAYHRAHATASSSSSASHDDAGRNTVYGAAGGRAWWLVMMWIAAAQRQRAPDVQVEIVATIADLHVARVKRLVVSVYRRVQADVGCWLLRKTSQELYVSLLEHDDEYRVVGLGDDPTTVLGRRGDVLVRVRVADSNDNQFRIDTVLSRYDLHVDVPIGPYEHYYGHEATLACPSGRSDA